jgi:hypothetical protein
MARPAMMNGRPKSTAQPPLSCFAGRTAFEDIRMDFSMGAALHKPPDTRNHRVS